MVGLPVREVLSLLPGKAIARLCEMRGLTARGLDTRREALARLYRGNHDDFFADLTKDDLVELLGRSTIEVKGTWWYLPSAGTYSKDELLRIARRAFCTDAVPREFATVPDEEDEEVRDPGPSGALTDEATVSFVRNNNLEHLVEKATGHDEATVEAWLTGEHGNTKLRRLFRLYWPTNFTVARVVRENLYRRVMYATGKGASEVRTAIESAAYGQCLVRTVLYPNSEEELDEPAEGAEGNPWSSRFRSLHAKFDRPRD